MTKFLMTAVAALIPISALQAVPISCTDPSLNTLAEYIAQSAGGGCFVQDKLFTDFTYTGGGAVTAGDVDVQTVFTVAPGQDIHGFIFTTPLGSWTAGFTLGYTISVDPPTPAFRITSALTQGNFGIVANSASVSNTLGNGVVQTVARGSETRVDGFAPEQSLTVSNAGTIPSGGFLLSLENNFIQTAVPEPASVFLAGSVLLLAGLARRRRAR